MPFKHALKHAGGWVALATLSLSSRVSAAACVLTYHRVANAGVFDQSLDDWNITPARLERQFIWLSKYAYCIPLADLLHMDSDGNFGKPVVALTFDDGFANFRHDVLPLLERYQLPATLFVVTRFVGLIEPYPFDRWGKKNYARTPALAWRPISWAEIEECVNSKLVSIGSHSHEHLNALNASDKQLAEEAEVSREILRHRLGLEHASLYAYPYGSSRLGHVRSAYIEAVRKAGYRQALTTDLGMAGRATPPFQIPRVEVHAWDSPYIVKAKVYGRLWPQHICDRFRQAQRGSSQ